MLTVLLKLTMDQPTVVTKRQLVFKTGSSYLLVLIP